MSKNIIINGDFRIGQRGTTFASVTNGDYTLDRWAVLSNGSSVVDISQVSHTSETPAGDLNAINAEVKADDLKFGIIQIIEKGNIDSLLENVVSLSFQAKASPGIPSGRP